MLITSRAFVNGANDTVNGINDTVNGENCTINGTNDTVNGTNDTVNGANDTVNGANDTVNGTNDTLNIPDKTKDVLKAIIENPHITSKDLSSKLKCTIITVKRHIAVLKQQGIIRRVGSDKTGHWEFLINK